MIKCPSELGPRLPFLPIPESKLEEGNPLLQAPWSRLVTNMAALMNALSSRITGQRFCVTFHVLSHKYKMKHIGIYVQRKDT